MIAKVLLSITCLFTLVLPQSVFGSIIPLTSYQLHQIQKIVESGDHKQLYHWLKTGGSLLHRFELPEAQRLKGKKFPLICALARYIGKSKKHLDCLKVACYHEFTYGQSAVLDSTDDAGCTALHILLHVLKNTSHEYVLDAIEFLLDQGARPDIKCGQTQKSALDVVNDLINEEQKNLHYVAAATLYNEQVEINNFINVFKDVWQLFAANFKQQSPLKNLNVAKNMILKSIENSRNCK